MVAAERGPLASRCATAIPIPESAVLVDEPSIHVRLLHSRRRQQHPHCHPLSSPSPELAHTPRNENFPAVSGLSLFALTGHESPWLQRSLFFAPFFAGAGIEALTPTIGSPACALGAFIAAVRKPEVALVPPKEEVRLQICHIPK